MLLLPDDHVPSPPEHSLAGSLKRTSGEIADELHDGGHVLHAGYREIAVGNGVEPDDPALKPCR